MSIFSWRHAIDECPGGDVREPDDFYGERFRGVARWLQPIAFAPRLYARRRCNALALSGTLTHGNPFSWKIVETFDLELRFKDNVLPRFASYLFHYAVIFRASFSPRAIGILACLFAMFMAGGTGMACKPKTAAPSPAPSASSTPTEGKTSGVPAPSGGSAGDKAAAKKAADAAKDQARRAAAEAVPVETALVARGPISAFLSFNSTLETEATVDIYPQTGGQVEALIVEEGRVVRQGDPLLQIEDRELRVEVEERAATFEHLRQGFARIDDLFQRNLINKQEYDDKRYQLEQARLQLERAKLRLAYATVRAPFDGVISAREAQVGARVGTGTKLFSMVKLDEIVARVFVPGRYLATVAENQAAVVTSEFLPDRTFKGWVKRISPVIDPKSGTFKVTVGVRGDKPAELPPGLFVGVRIITDTRPSAVLLPKRAVVYEGGERYVFAVVKGRAVKRKLEAGFEDPQNIEARSGFEVGTPVIVLGHSGLKDGAMVRTVDAAAPPVTPLPDATAKDGGPKIDPAKAAAAAVEPAKAGG